MAFFVLVLTAGPGLVGPGLVGPGLVGSGLVGLGLVGSAWAGDADVIGAVARRTARGIYDLDVTIRSRDTGWDRYADRIEVLGPDGNVLAVRVLEHPHEQEQPFTRDVSQAKIPIGVDEVTIRVRFKPTGFDGEVFRLRLDGK